MKNVLILLLIYFSLDILSYYNRDNNYIGKWEVISVAPKSEAGAAKALSRVLAYSKQEGVGASLYLQNSVFEMYFDGRRVLKVPIKYRRINNQLCFGAIEPDKCISEHNGGTAILSMPTADLVVKRDRLYYLSPGFIMSGL